MLREPVRGEEKRGARAGREGVEHGARARGQCVQVAGMVVPRFHARQRQPRPPPLHHAQKLRHARAGAGLGVVRIHGERDQASAAQRLQPVQRRVGVGIPVAHGHRVLHVVAARAKAFHHSFSLLRGPAHERCAAADLRVILLHLPRPLHRDQPTDRPLPDRAAGEADDLAVAEEPDKEGTHRGERVGPAKIQEQDAGLLASELRVWALHTVREKIGFFSASFFF